MSVLLRLCVAALAAGVSTALPCEAAAPGAAPVCGTPMLFPVVPWPRAFEVLVPGDPPVPLMVSPFDSVDPPAEPVAPADDPAEPPPET